MAKREMHNVEDILMLNPLQEGILYHYLEDPGSEQYFEQLCLRVAGELRLPEFTAAWNTVVQTNEMLRAVFRWKKLERPVQIVQKEQKITVQLTDLIGCAPDEQEHLLQEVMTEERKAGFDLEKGPLLRIQACRLGTAQYAIILSYHHILWDGWSTGIIVHELFRIYDSLLRDEEPVLREKKRFKEYLRWLKSRNREHASQFWRKYLAGVETHTMLPAEFYQPPVAIQAQPYEMTLPESLVAQLEAVAKEYSVTVPTILSAAWGLVLERYNQTGDVLFGITVSGRPGEITGIEEMVGLFINTIPVRVRVTAEEMVTELLHQMSMDATRQKEFETTPLVEIQEQSPLARGQRLFDSLLVMETYPLEQVMLSLQDSTLRIEGYEAVEMTNYDLAIVMTLKPEVHLRWLYRNETFGADTIAQLGRLYQQMLMAMLAEPQQKICELSLLTAEEKQLLHQFNDNRRDYPRQETILQAFAAQVARTPDIPAVLEAERVLTYSELDSMSRRIQMYLWKKGVQPEAIVGILVEPSLEMILCIFGIIKAGGAYLPIDPENPLERIRFILADSGANILLVQSKFLGKGQDLLGEVEVLELDAILQGWDTSQPMATADSNDQVASLSTKSMANCSDAEMGGITQEGIDISHVQYAFDSKTTNLVDCLASERVTMTQQVVDFVQPQFAREAEPANLAYIIYTSGSTGQPKGVMVEHGSLMNLLTFMQQEYPTRPGETWLLKTPYTFDVSVTEIFGWILGGGRLAILRPGEAKEPRAILNALAQYRVTHINFVPSMYNGFMDYLETVGAEALQQVRYLMVAGEAISKEQATRLSKLTRQVEMINLYGPTEATVYATHFPLREMKAYPSVPIGKGVANTSLYILDRMDHHQPVGFPGELCIAGDGLSRGYLHRPELTAAKFIDYPGTGRMYRTGDLARWLPDGNLEYLGRIDDQVKVSGYRIELGEIENQLLSHPSVNQATVAALRDAQGTAYLCAYLIADEEIDSSELKHQLAKELPEYMIPTHFVRLTAFPLTASGKLNRRALPVPEMRAAHYVAPRTVVEKKLATIWQELLSVEQVGLQDHFTALGGHSIKAVQISARIYKEFGVEVSIKDLFQAPTVEAQAALIEKQCTTKIAGDVQSVAIPVQPIQEHYPASAAQNRLYLINQLDPESLAYNMPVAFELRGRFDLARFKRVIDTLIQRHEALRTSFILMNGELRQRISSEIDLKVVYVEGSVEEGNRDALYARFVQPFDLAVAPLLRVQCLRFHEEHYLLFLDMHHIISDGASMDLFLEEFRLAYAGEELLPLRLQYRDYAVWQAQAAANGAFQVDEEYWLREFAGELPVLNLPADRQRPATLQRRADSVDFCFSPELTNQVHQLTETAEVSLFMILFSSFNILLAKYSGVEELVVGTPVNGRPHPDMQSMMGMFVNTLAIRSEPKGEMSFADYLAQVKEKILQGLTHQNYQFDQLVERLNLERDRNRNPLFDVLFALQEVRRAEQRLQFPGLEFRYLPFASTVSKFDLTLFAEDTPEGLSFRLEYLTQLFDQGTMERMAEHLQNLVLCVVQHPEILLKDVELISREEKELLLYGFNDTETEYPRDKTVPELFIEQARWTPERVAVRFEETQLTYHELDVRSQQVAAHLRCRGVIPDELVAVLAEPSLEMICGILGVLRAGGAYLPLDPEFPEERKRFMLQDAGVRIMLTTAQTATTSKELFAGEIFNLHTLLGAEPAQALAHDRQGFAKSEPTATQITVTPENLAYVMYTSGSTGQPKGVMIPHRGIVRLIYETSYRALTEEERFVQLSTFTFDASTFHIWGPLLRGGCLVLVQKDTVLSREKLATLLKEEKVTGGFWTSSFFNQMIDECPDIFREMKHVYIGGEALSVPHIRKALELLPDTHFINGYGPTENTTFTTYYPVNEVLAGRSIPIGKPLSNTRVYILDRYRKLVPLGAVGELYIGGDGLARGYLNRPELTAERFVESPYDYGELLYKSGDLVRYLPDGNIEFWGRADQQVKIRGFRIELAEIESMLLQQPGVRNACVQVYLDGSGQKYLAAFLVGEGELSVVELRQNLLQVLPVYMVPNTFVQLPNLPLTPQGKVDRRALPEPQAERTRSEYVAPQNPVEAKIAEIFADVLQCGPVGAQDNFFLLGGHSLKATQVIARIARDLGVELPFRDLFQNPVVEDLARLITAADKTLDQQIPRQPERACYPVSPAQQRMVLLHQLSGEDTAYNIPLTVWVEGALDHVRLEEAFRSVIARHESLRTIFKVMQGETVQCILPTVSFTLGCSVLTGGEVEAQGKFREFVRPFQLQVAPLLRAELLQVTSEKHLLFLDMHHSIADGLSLHNLVQELAAAYVGEPLPELPLQYRDFAVWQNERMESAEMRQNEAYWLREFAGEVPVLNLPADEPRPAMQSFVGRSYDFTLPREIVGGLTDFAQKQGATLNAVLLALYKILLSRYSGQDDLVVGMPVAGRKHGDLEKLIGMFVNTLAIRSHPEAPKRFREYFKEVRDQVIRAQDHQDYPFEMLVERLQLERDMSRNPLFDVVFALQNMVNGGTIQMGDLKFRPWQMPGEVAKFDLTLTATEGEGLLHCRFDYSTKLFHAHIITQMAGHFCNLAREVLKNPEQTLLELEMLSPEEKVQLLYTWNDTTVPYPADRTLAERFEEQVQKYPEKVAVRLADETLSYAELNARANRVAWALREEGVVPEQIVALMVERSLTMLVGILGIIKAGGAYLPVDPDLPEERKQYMLRDADVRILLTQSALVAEGLLFREIQQSPVEHQSPRMEQQSLQHCAQQENSAEQLKDVLGKNGMLILDLEDDEFFDRYSDANPPLVSRPENLAYVIYTSGSTGQPKGVMIEQYGVNRLFHGVDYMKVGENARILQLSSYNFDASVVDIWSALLFGGELILLRKENLLAPQELAEIFRREQITFCLITPVLFNRLLDEAPDCLASVRYLMIGGDVLSVSHIQKAQQLLPETVLVNGYGPTETTVLSTTHRIHQLSENCWTVPIGRPVPNLKVYLLDAYQRPVPTGVVGEIYVGGEGLARGYLKRDELTREKFLANPWVPGERIYRSGDLGRYWPDGTIQFMGRIDHQVKLRGLRIELGEIEAVLAQYPGIKEAVVLIRGEAEACALVGYYTADRIIEAAELRQALLRVLPDYMVPAHYQQLAHFPLTSTGKIDRRKLPDLTDDRMQQRDYVAPQNAIEEKVAAIYAEVLGVEEVGATDHFFELGGHSLKASQVTAALTQEFEVELAIRDLFQAPVVRELAQLIAESKVKRHIEIEHLPDAEEYPVSSAQKRLFILTHLDVQNTVYNMPLAMQIEGQLDMDSLTNAFQQLVRRHESLRTAFGLAQGEPVQRILPAAEVEIKMSEITPAEVEQKFSKFVRPFDLSQAPLLRVEIVKIGQGRYLLLVDLHHIVADGVSMDLLLQEFTQLYAGVVLPPLCLQYRDFAVWQNQMLLAERERLEQYWLTVFQEEVPVLQLPTDEPRLSVQNFAGNTHTFIVDRVLLQELKALAQRTGSTLYMVLLAVYAIFLSRYSGQEDVVVGSPIAGRQHPDLQPLIGMFVNTLALRMAPCGSKTVLEFLQEVQEIILGAVEHQDYPFELLVERLQLDRNLSRNPLFDTVFTLQNLHTGVRQMEVAGVQFSEYNLDMDRAKFDLTLTARELPDGLHFHLNYMTSLFCHETIERMARHYVNLLKAVTVDAGHSMASLEMLDPAEKAQILHRGCATGVDFPSERSIADLIAGWGEQTPSAVAVTYGNESLTYAELNQRADELAFRLQQYGVQPDCVVGIMAGRSLEFIVGMLAVLKAGGAYLPLNPEYPAERIEFMLTDSGAQILLIEPECRNRVNFSGETVVLGASEGNNMGTVQRRYAGNNLAYVIYTSGSTGRPKGVMIEHRSLTNFLYATRQFFGGHIGPGDRSLSLANIAFDVSIFENWLPLAFGATLVLYEGPALFDVDELARRLIDQAITMAYIPPTLLKDLAGRLQTVDLSRLRLNKMFVGVEPIKDYVLEEYCKLNSEMWIVNGYGPTESTVCTTNYIYTRRQPVGKNIPIGQPLANLQVFLLDRYGNLVPAGVPGELCVSGIGLARGYLNRPDVTAEKFVNNPYIPGERMYRTGDLAYWLPDGMIQFVGRVDNQVKIRGHRIEPGEIETQLLRVPGLDAAVVIPRERQDGVKYLAAYFTANREMTAQELRAHLLQQLPEYMVPSFFVQLSHLPTTLSGKIDRRALPEPEGRVQTGKEYIAPRNGVEESLAQIWQQILGVPQVSINETFFELGGNSLLLIKAFEALKSAFPDLELTIADLFTYNTVLQLAELIQKQLPDSGEEAEEAIEEFFM